VARRWDRPGTRDCSTEPAHRQGFGVSQPDGVAGVWFGEHRRAGVDGQEDPEDRLAREVGEAASLPHLSLRGQCGNAPGLSATPLAVPSRLVVLASQRQ
jgi:hypothetical protein